MHKHAFHNIMKIVFLFINALILCPSLPSANSGTIGHTSMDAFYPVLDNATESGEKGGWDRPPHWPDSSQADTRYIVAVSVFTDTWPFFPANGCQWDLTKVYGIGQREIRQQPSSINDIRLRTGSHHNPFCGSGCHGINVNSVVEPAAMFLFGSGLAGFGMLRRKVEKQDQNLSVSMKGEALDGAAFSSNFNEVVPVDSIAKTVNKIT